jgi:undecaprenyl diphosphate synthase
MSGIVPKHIGYIVDGNRHWAKARGLTDHEGHLAGYEAAQDIILATFEAGIEYASAYIFSTENWKRSKIEVRNLMSLIFKPDQTDVKRLMDNNIRIRILGSREGLNKRILQKIDEIEAKSAANTGGTLALCFNYGGQLELADAFKKMLKAGVTADEVRPEVIAEHLYAPDIPPVDLIVRTGGNQRISNFMLWRAAYSELLFLDKCWPDMTKADVTAILEEYSARHRRFGG